MNVKTVKKPARRVDTSYVSRFKMQAYGYNNLYPQNIAQITEASGTAMLCIDRYARFIEGYGFGNDAVAEYILNNEGDTTDDILKNVAADLAKFGGFALHVNYNVLCQVSDVHHVPFENCRLEEPDDKGHVAHVLVHQDWTQRKTRNGKKLRVTEENIERFDIFNSDPDIVSQQIDNAGGIDTYKGQIMWCSLDGKFVYPKARYDSAITEISTDEGLGNVKARNVRNNFLVSCMLISKKGVPKTDPETGDEIDSGQMISDEDLQQFQGDENSLKILAIELENDEDEPKVVAFPTKNFDKEFSVTDASVIERIYAQFHQELFYAIRIGKLGFSGQVMQDAYEYYAGEVTVEQRFIERVFKKVFSAYVDPALQTLDLTLQPLKYISSEVAGNNTID